MKKHSKEHVIEIGEKLFRSQGYHFTGTEDILKASDYPRSSFYYNFKSKEGFATQVLENYGSSAEQFYSSIFKDEKLGGPIDRLRYFSKMMTAGAVKKQFTSECLIQKLSIECAGANENFRQSINDQLNKLLSVISTCISEGQAANEIRSDKSAQELAEYYHGQLYGAFILARLQNDGEVMSKSLKTVVENMVS